MVEILPIKILTAEDAPIFGSLNVSLGRLQRAGLAVPSAVVITPPNLILKTTLERYSLHSTEVFEQTLALVKKELNSIPPPEPLISEAGKHKKFFLQGKQFSKVKDLWLGLLELWVDQIRNRLWNSGFYLGVTDNLDCQIVVFTNKLTAYGNAFFDPLQDDVVISTKLGKLDPEDLKKVTEMVQIANKKLLIPHEYEWILDGGVKLVGIKPFTPLPVTSSQPIVVGSKVEPCERSYPKSAVKVFFDLSAGFTIEKNIDGVYIASEKIFDLNKPRESFDNLVFRLVESALTFPDAPILFKLADKSEGFGKVRGTLRLLHQKSLLTPLLEALDFTRHKKGLNNIHIVIPYLRNVGELLQIKRELSTYKLVRKNSLKIFSEVAVPENIINLEKYLEAGIDGVVLNLDELIAHLNGFDPLEGELSYYKNEVEGLMKFLEDGIRLLHKFRMPYLAYGTLSLYPKVLEFLVEKGVYGVVVERYEAHSVKDLLHQAERRMILRRG